MRQKLFIVLCMLLVRQIELFNAIEISAQSKDISYNFTDANGQKQGQWQGFYNNGKVKYKGFFKDNKPVGEFLRYYEDGTLMARQYFDENSNNSKIIYYYQNGTKAAEGQYVAKLRDSTWNFYSYYDKTLRLKENYVMGKKHGVSIKYYPTKRPSEIVNWQNDMKHGEWKQYFENGNVKLEGFYNNDKRDGIFRIYRPNGTPEIFGMFKNNLMEGDWVYYDEKGKEKLRIRYRKGQALNSEVLDSIQQEIFKTIDANKGKIPEPTENDLIPMH